MTKPQISFVSFIAGLSLGIVAMLLRQPSDDDSAYAGKYYYVDEAYTVHSSRNCKHIYSKDKTAIITIRAKRGEPINYDYTCTCITDAQYEEVRVAKDKYEERQITYEQANINPTKTYKRKRRIKK